MNEQRSIDLIFQQCLDLMSVERISVDQVLDRFPEHVEELRPLLETVVWLREKAKAFDPRPGFVPATRQRIVNQIKQEQLDAQSRNEKKEPFWRRSSFRMVWLTSSALLVLVFLLFISSRTLTATRNAIPGQANYPLKLLVEKAQIAFTADDYKAAQLYIDFSSRRQSEIEELIIEGHYDLLPEAIKNYQDEVSLALGALEHLADSDPTNAQKLALALNEALSNQLASLAVLLDVVPAQYKAELNGMMQFTMDRSGEVQTLLEMVINPALGTATATATEMAFSPSLTKSGPTVTPTPTSGTTSNPISSFPETPTITSTLILPVGTGVSVFTSTSTSTPTITPTITTTPTPTPTTVEGDEKPDTKTPRPPNTHKPPTHTPKPKNPPKLQNTPQPQATSAPPPDPVATQPREEPKSTKEPKP